MKTPAEEKQEGFQAPINDTTITVRHAEHLMIKAFQNVAEHMESISKELIHESNIRRNKVKLAKKGEITPQEKEALIREANLLEGRHQGLKMISIPIIVAACEMIAKDETEEKDGVGIILPNHMKL